MSPRSPRIPAPDRIRSLHAPYAWIDCRLLLEHRIAELSPVDMALYLFLALAADRQGISYYHLESIAKRLGHIDWGALHEARDHLEEVGLIAFLPFSPHDPNGFYQVLELPPRLADSQGRR